MSKETHASRKEETAAQVEARIQRENAALTAQTQARLEQEKAEHEAKMAKQKTARDPYAIGGPRVHEGHTISVDNVHVGKRLRTLNKKKVDALAESMSYQGLIHPIIVRKNDTAYDLVVGLHRLEAAKKLGWTCLRATVHHSDNPMSDDAAALAEIDENLIRAELSPAERADHVGRRKEIYERLNPTTKHGAAPGKAGGRQLGVFR